MYTEKVLSVTHYTDRLFSFRTTRPQSFKFIDGEFVTIGLDTDEKSYGLEPDGTIMRAYSICSPSYDEHLEFYSIKVPDGPLTSRLQHIEVGDNIIINKKATGTLTIDALLPGRNLYLLGTGTGAAPFFSLARSIDIYNRYDNVIFAWGVRTVSELAYDYHEMLTHLNEHEVYGELTQGKFHYYPTVTRELFVNEGRVTDAFYTGKIQSSLNLSNFDPKQDRVAVCGSTEMNLELKHYFIDNFGMKYGSIREPGEFTLERAFVG